MRSATLRLPAWLGAALLLGCSTAKHGDPNTNTPTSTSASGSGAECPTGGPSVSVKIRDRAKGTNLPNDELGVLLGWIGGFVQPCREATPEAPHFTLEIQLDPSGSPSFDLIERAALPALAACLDESFAAAPPPPPETMTVAIVIPWGCPTLGPGTAPGSEATEPGSEATEPAATEHAATPPATTPPAP